MKSIFVHALVASAFVVGAAPAFAQDQAAVAMVTSIELKQLAASADPKDHLRARDHFEALASVYDADVARYNRMAQTSSGATRGGGSNAAHFRVLAVRATEAAAAVRELAAAHEKLAAGVTVPLSKDAAKHAEHGAPPNERQILELVAGASTAADHRVLEGYFTDVARRYTTESKEHAAMAVAYRGTRIATSAVHCERAAKSTSAAAAEATAAAAEHRAKAAAAR